VAAVDVAFECIACISNEVADCWSATKPEELPVVKCDNATCFSGIWSKYGLKEETYFFDFQLLKEPLQKIDEN